MKKILLLLLFAHTLFAQPTYHFDLLKDLNNTTNDADIKFVINVGNTAVIFHADKDINTGKTILRLWKNNGNTLENFASSDLFGEYTTYRKPIVIDDYIFFYVQNNGGGENGIYLAKLNSSVIKYVGYIHPISLSTGNIAVLKFNDKIYYSYESQSSEGRLYYYNEITNQSTEIQGANLNFYDPQNVTIVNNKLYFTATTGDIFDPKQQLWTSDGTSAGTHIVKELAPNGMTLGHMTSVGNSVIFDAAENNVYSLYVSDGTTAGTYPFKNLQSFSTNEYGFVTIDAMHSFGDKAIIRLTGKEIWITDGTDANTQFVAYYNAIGLFQNDDLAVMNGCLFLTDGSGKLFKTNGVITTLLKSNGIEPTYHDNFKMILNLTDNNLYYAIREVFFKTDGTTPGTSLISDKLYSDADFERRHQHFSIASNKIFAHTCPKDYKKFGTEIYEILTDTIRLVKDLDPTTKSADVQFLLNANEKSYFFARIDGPISVEYGICETDGTPEGTRGPVTGNFSYPQNYFSFNGRLHLLNGNQLLKVNFTTKNFESIKTFSKGPALITPIQSSNKFYFVLTGNYEHEVWVSDGTTDGTTKIGTFDETEPFESFALYNQQLYVFTTKAGTTRVWKYSNDTTPPTLLKTINSYPARRTYTSFRNKLLFMIYSQTGIEIWASDGTSNGTTQINSFPLDVVIDPELIHFTDSYYYYSVFADNQTKVWKSDGTLVGTTVVSNILEASSGVKEFCLCNNNVFFVLNKAEDSSNSFLYKYNSTSGTTTFVSKLTWPEINNIKLVYCINRQLYFPRSGEWIEHEKRYLYTSDGTQEGTRKILPLENTPYFFTHSLRDGYLYPLNDHELLVKMNDKFYSHEWFTFRTCEPALTNLDGIATDSKIQTSPTFIESTEKIIAENKVYYFAPKSITLNAGFSANAQSVFKAEIKNKTCTLRQ